MHKLWQDQAKVAQSHQVLVDSTFNIALEELVAKIPTPDPESTAMTSDELQSLFDSGITGVNDRSRSFGQPPTSVLNKMRENMAEEHSSNEQPDEEFLEDLRDDIAKWEIKDEVDESGRFLLMLISRHRRASRMMPCLPKTMYPSMQRRAAVVNDRFIYL
ncbi:hypothetical protein SNK04_009069 [Fusarium graminearum]